MTEEPERVFRPWGSWEVVARLPGVVVKIFRVERGQRMSLQYHRHRTEQWFVVSGKGRLELDGQAFDIIPRDRVTIEPLSHHRIASVGDRPLVIVEVQSGAPDEDDIVRLEDDYGRA